MSKRQDLIQKYAADLEGKCKVSVDLDLLEKVVIGCGPSIYSPDAESIAASDPEELARVRKNFLMGKLALPDTPALDEALDAAIDAYGRSERKKYRAVIYYILVKHFRKDQVYA